MQFWKGASSSGGAISINSGIISFVGCEFSRNSAYYQGGAMYISDGQVSITSCSFDGSFAEEVHPTLGCMNCLRHAAINREEGPCM